MQTFPRPTATHPRTERVPVAGTCPECGGEDLARYPVLSEGGWWEATKCQACLASVRREPAPALGSFVPLGTTVTGI